MNVYNKFVQAMFERKKMKIFTCTNIFFNPLYMCVCVWTWNYGPVCWDCRIRKQHLCRGIKFPQRVS